MGYSYVRGNFLGGERSKFAQGRYDLQDYVTGLNVCLNTIPVESGGTVRRPGERFIAQTFGGRPGRLLPFPFRNIQPYTIELTQDTLRMLATTLTTTGISVVTTNDPRTVLAISAATPAEVTTDAAHGWANGNHVQFELAGASPAELQYREFAITVTAVDKFTLVDQTTGQPVDGSQLGTVLGGTKVDRMLIIGSPYGAPGTTTGLDQVRRAQAEDRVVLLHRAVKPYGLTVLSQPPATTPPRGGTFATFELAPASLNDGPYLDQYVGTTVTNTGTSGTITLQTGGAPFPGFVAADVGRLIRLFSQPAQWNGATAYVGGDKVALYQDPVNQPAVATYYQCTAPSTGHTPNLTPTEWALVTGTQYATWTWGTITAVNAPDNVSVLISGAPLLYNSSTIYAWRLGVYGGANGYPSCAIYHEGRLWLGGAVANRFDASVANGITVDAGILTVRFAPTDASGTVGSANAISGVCNAEDVNPILSMRSHQQGVIAITQAGEWLLYAPAQGAIAPNNIGAVRLTKIGGLNTEAVSAEHTFLFVHKFGRLIMEYFADVFSGKLSAPRMNWLSKHLTKGGIQEIAYQQELTPTLWARVSDKLVGWVYKREVLTAASQPTIAAGHRHELGSGRTVESISAGPSVDGATDTLLMITADAVGGPRFIGALTDIPDEGATLLDTAYVDCAVAPVWTYSVPTVDAPYGGMALRGLWPLNNQTVAVVIGGIDCGDRLVSNGGIDVPFGDGISDGTGTGLLTESYVSGISAIPIWCGFSYTSQVQIVRPNASAETGARAGPGFMKLKQAGWAAFQVEGVVTNSIEIGTAFDKLLPLEFKYENDVPFTILDQFSGIVRMNPEDDPGFDSMLCWQVTRPYPCNMVAVGAVLDTTDI